MEHLFTIIIEFRGGTYISQVVAKDESEALIQGISNLEVDKIQFFGEKTKSEMMKEAKVERPAPIENTQGVFIIALSPFGKFTTVHLIKTIPDCTQQCDELSLASFMT